MPPICGLVRVDDNRTDVNLAPHRENTHLEAVPAGLPSRACGFGFSAIGRRTRGRALCDVLLFYPGFKI